MPETRETFDDLPILSELRSDLARACRTKEHRRRAATLAPLRRRWSWPARLAIAIAVPALLVVAILAATTRAPGSHARSGSSHAGDGRSLATGGGGSVVHTELVSFSRAASGTITAVITNPQAAQSQLDAAFRAQGLDIAVRALPVSPSLVGSIIYTDLPNVQPVHAGSCLTGGAGQCTVGLVIPAGFRGDGQVEIGRAARPGEAFASTASVFGPGEVLHCSGLLGETVSAAIPVLKEHDLNVQWRRESTNQTPAPEQKGTGTSATVTTSGGHDQTLTSPPAGEYVQDAALLSSNQIIVWIASRSTVSAGYEQQLESGCAK